MPRKDAPHSKSSQSWTRTRRLKPQSLAQRQEIGITAFPAIGRRFGVLFRQLNFRLTMSNSIGGTRTMKNDRVEMYRVRMQEIVYRLDVVESLLHGDSSLLYLPTTVECVYLQFRKVLELIATASLVANHDADDVLRKEGMRKWHAGDILEAVETVNPDYYFPKPVRLVERSRDGFSVGLDGYRGEWKDFKGDYLTREKFTTLYNVCGGLLHSPNPFDKKAIVQNTKGDKRKMQQARKWRRRIIELVTHHTFSLVGEKDTLYVCHTVGPSADFHVARFQKLEIPDNPTPEDIAEARRRFLGSGA